MISFTNNLFFIENITLNKALFQDMINFFSLSAESNNVKTETYIRLFFFQNHNNFFKSGFIFCDFQNPWTSFSFSFSIEEKYVVLKT